ncbi:hypothetical protein AB0J71_38075 [Nonomuraea sp. NPDC049637]|uniref:hypothetical protein n=1 Tax=Nonomuraea sp. NPDC049637 TaxID=3154356 RepID=UPI00344502A1
MRKLINLLEDRALKGKAAEKLLNDCQAWEAAYRDIFNRALALVESAHPDPAKPTDPLLGLGRPPLYLLGRSAYESARKPDWPQHRRASWLSPWFPIRATYG